MALSGGGEALPGGGDYVRGMGVELGSCCKPTGVVKKDKRWRRGRK